MRKGSGMSPDGLAISRRSARAHDREHPLDQKGEHCERSDGLSQEPGKCEGEQEHDEESGYRREDEPCPTGHQLERASRRAAEGGTMALGVISKAGAEPRTKRWAVPYPLEGSGTAQIRAAGRLPHLPGGARKRTGRVPAESRLATGAYPRRPASNQEGRKIPPG